jgi:hypothetical protein
VVWIIGSVKCRAAYAAYELFALKLLGLPPACIFLEDDPNEVLIRGLLEIAHLFSLGVFPKRGWVNQ